MPTTKNPLRKLLYVALFIGLLLAALASFAWRPMSTDGWGIVSENHVPGFAHEDPTIAAVADTHQALNLSIWNDRDLDDAVDYACDKLNDAHADARANDTPAATVERIAAVRDYACEGVRDGDIGHVGLHNAVQALELHLLTEHRNR